MLSKIRKTLNLNQKLALALPYIIISIFLIILPIILIIVSAFSSTDSEFSSWQLVTNLNTWKIIWRSVYVGLISAILCLLIAFPYAYMISTARSKIFQIYALSLIISPMAIFTIARIYSIKGLFLAIFATNPNALNSELFIILGLTYLNLPLMVMPLYTVFKDMPKNIVEASNDLGYNNFQTIFKVILPYGTKAILSGLAMIFLASATTFVISAKLLPDGSQFQLIGDLINSKINPGNKYDLQSGSALVIVVSAIFIGIYSLFLLIPKLIFKFKKGAHYE
ncbi:ABC transporter permease [Mycoplasma buteonis]|uniref:ABC transporter permease n=1 Tax=Mycoplasma buteonis TaxID=171280 RepID=UPI00055BFCD9|nr:ABC transporter permease [Mycoplasma buteonis]